MKPHVCRLVRQEKYSYGAYIAELGDEERYPFPMDFDHRDCTEQRFRERAEFRRFVPSSTYWLLKTESFGVSNLRHFLNERIINAGGHIGLGIRPRRVAAIGILLLSLTIAEARKSIGELQFMA